MMFNLSPLWNSYNCFSHTNEAGKYTRKFDFVLHVLSQTEEWIMIQVNIDRFILRYFGKNASLILITMQKWFQNHKNEFIS